MDGRVVCIVYWGGGGGAGGYDGRSHVHCHEVDKPLDGGRGRSREPVANLADRPDGLPRQLWVDVDGVFPQLCDDGLRRICVGEKSETADLRVLYARRLVVPANAPNVKNTMGKARVAS